MAKSGHHFPPGAGFTHSSGKVQSVKGYTRTVPKKAVGGPMRPVGMSGPKMIPAVGPPPMAQAPIMRNPQPSIVRPMPVRRGALALAEGGAVKRMGDGTMTTEEIGDQGNAVVVRREPISEFDKEYGGKGSLRTGYKKGGKITKGAARKIAKSEVAAHVARPAPKGHKGFSKTPMFGKK